MTKRGSANGGALLFLVVVCVVGLLGWWFISSVETLAYYGVSSWSPIPPAAWAFVAVGFILALLGAIAIGGGGRLTRSGFTVHGSKQRGRH